MTLSLLAILLGLAFGLTNLYGVLKPAHYAALLRKFPRYTPLGYVLILVATFWFLHYVGQETVADFLAFKPLLYALFAGVGIGACLFVRDYLPVRGLAVLMLLGAKLVVDTARWVDTEWRLVLVTWAYLWIVAGMWWTISPWRLRNIIEWNTANLPRTRLLAGLRCVFGLFVALLGGTAYRQAEAPSTAWLHSAPRPASLVAAALGQAPLAYDVHIDSPPRPSARQG